MLLYFVVSAKTSTKKARPGFVVVSLRFYCAIFYFCFASIELCRYERFGQFNGRHVFESLYVLFENLLLKTLVFVLFCSVQKDLGAAGGSGGGGGGGGKATGVRVSTLDFG